MTTEDFTIELFYRLDQELLDVKKHPQAHLYPSEVVTLAFLFARTGVGNRAFYRWLKRDWRNLFPRLPERTRLFRLFKSHQHLTERFLAHPSVLGVIDSFGIELIHPIREGRTANQIARKGISNHRWIVGGKLCLLLNQDGLVVAWDCATANVYDGQQFRPLIEQVEEAMIVLADSAFHSAGGDPANLKICPRGTWNDRMIVETVFSMLTLISHFKKVMHRVWEYFEMRLGYTMALFNVLAQWYGIQADETGKIHVSIAEFSL